jgi:hypothetical protein
MSEGLAPVNGGWQKKPTSWLIIPTVPPYKSKYPYLYSVQASLLLQGTNSTLQHRQLDPSRRAAQLKRACLEYSNTHVTSHQSCRQDAPTTGASSSIAILDDNSMHQLMMKQVFTFNGSLLLSLGYPSQITQPTPNKYAHPLHKGVKKTVRNQFSHRPVNIEKQRTVPTARTLYRVTTILRFRIVA